MVKPLMLVWAILILLIPAVPAEAATEAAWNVSCPISHFGRNDPIVYPKQFGASHEHAFYANKSTDANTTTESLLASPSTCERGFENTDHSAYWIPSIYRKLPNGSLEEIKGDTKQLRMTIYYRRAGNATGDKVSMIPQGLRMIAGDGKATAAQSTNIVSFRCRSLNGGASTAKQANIPTCGAGQFIQGVIRFPNCWDGKNLDSADHKSHMTYSSGKTQSCPATHPTKIPQLTFEAGYKTLSGAGSQYELSSGGQYSYHGDFFAAWDNKVQSALVNGCLNVAKKCTGIKLADVPIAAASPNAGQGQVLSASTAPPPTPSSLPQTGALTALSGIAGIGVTGYAWHAFRDRRRALLNALRRHH